MVWLALEDADTNEVTDFEEVTVQQALYLMHGYRVDKHKYTKCRVADGNGYIYDGVTYKGGFGYNLWVARKYLEENQK